MADPGTPEYQAQIKMMDLKSDPDVKIAPTSVEAQTIGPNGTLDYSRLDDDLTKPEAPPYQATTIVNNTLKPVVDAWSSSFKDADRGIADGRDYNDVMNGTITLAEAQNRSRNRLAGAPVDMSPYAGDLGPLVGTTKVIASMAPMLIDMGKGAGGGGAVGGAVGAAGGIIGGLIGMFGGPADPATVPAGIVGGTMLGTRIGATVGAGPGIALRVMETSSGQMLKTLTDDGVPLDKAKAFAQGVGVFNGALTVGGTALAGKAFMGAVTKELLASGAESSTSKVIVGAAEKTIMGRVANFIKDESAGSFEHMSIHSPFAKVIGNYLKNTGVAFTDIQLQRYVAALATTIVKAQNHIKQDDIKNLPDFFLKMYKNAVEDAKTAAKMIGAGEVVGGTVATFTGKALAAVNVHHPDISTHHAAAATIDSLINNKPIPSPEEYAQIEKQTKAGDKNKYQQWEHDREQRVLHAVAVKNEFLEGVKTTDSKGTKLTDSEMIHGERPAILPGPTTAQRFLDTLFDFPGKVRDTALSKLTKAKRDAIYKHLDPTDAITKLQAYVQKQQMYAQEAMEKASGLNGFGVTDAILKGSKRKLTVMYKDIHGQAQVWKGSALEGVGLLHDMGRDNNKAAVHRTGYTMSEDHTVKLDGTVVKGAKGKPIIWEGTTLEEQMQKSLGEYDGAGKFEDSKIYKIGTGIQDWFEKHNLPDLQKAYFHANGKEMQVVPPGRNGVRYSGQAMFKGAHADYDNFSKDFGESDQVKAMNDPGFTTDLVRHNLKLKNRNPVVSMIEGMQATGRYKYLDDLSKIYNLVLNDSDVKEAMGIRHGDALHEAITYQAAHIINGNSRIRNTFLNWANRWSSEYGHGILSLDIGRFPKHVSSVLTYALAHMGEGKRMPTSGMVDGMLTYWADPATWNQFMYSKSKGLQQKYAGNGSELLNAIRSEDLSAIDTHSFKNVGGKALTAGAQLSDQMGMTAVYTQALKMGKTPEEAMGLAEEALHSTQYSMRPDRQSNASINPYTKPFSFFTQYPTAMYQQGAIALREAGTHGGAENMYNAGRSVAITHAGMIAFVATDAAWTYATSDNDKEKSDANYRLFWAGLSGPSLAYLNMHDTGAAIHDAATWVGHQSDPDIQQTHDLKFGISLLPLDPINAAGDLAFNKGLHSVFSAEPVKFSEGMGAFIDLAKLARAAKPDRVPNIEPVARAIQKIAKDEERQQ